MVQRHIQKNKKITRDQLVEFYESHGLTPEDVQEAAQKIGKDMNIPSDFYTRISNRHMSEDTEKKIVEKEGADIAKKLEDLPSTRRLFYENIYDREMEAEVIEVLDGTKIILDQTVFYAEGGGQISDQGVLLIGETEYSVIDVQSIEGVILHVVDRPGIMKGDYVHGVIDWERRMALMRAHTSTHIIIGAARRVLGEHAWQAGASKTVQSARLDISHYARITRDQVEEIERLANIVVREGREVTCKFMQRDIAEKKYGFRLYQGGAVPGKEIRIVDMDDWDIEACGGTHLSNTSQIGLIKILGTERVQDGVERLVYAAGPYALEEIQRREALLMDAAELLGAPYDSILESIQNNIDNIKSLRSQLDDLRKSLGSELAGNLIEKALDIDGIKVVFYSDEIDFDFLIELGNAMEEIEPNIVAFLISTNQKRFGVKAGKRAMDKGIHAGNLTTKLGKLLGSGGGGAPYFGQGGGGDVDKFYENKSEMLKAVKAQLE